MKFLYRYQTAQNGVLEGEVSSSSEAEAYAQLRKSGIRPMKVWRKPGLFNSISIGKRWVAIILLSVVSLVSVVVAFNGTQGRGRGTGLLGEESSLSLPRQQIPPVKVAFRFRSETALADFARPGDLSGGFDLKEYLSDLSEALRTPVEIDDGDPESVRTLKRVVAGLKNEVRIALASGRSPEEAFVVMLERQRMESAYRSNLVDELSEEPEETFPARLEAVNETLKATGMAEIEVEECYLPDLEKL